jgi:hypothetical protein
MDLPDTTDRSNNSTYYFFLSGPVIDWASVPLSISKTSNNSTSSISIMSKTDTPTVTVTPSPQNTISKTVIVGISVGSVLVFLAIFVACSLVYKKLKRDQTKIKRGSSHPDGQGAFNGADFQIPSDSDKVSSAYIQQYPPAYQQHQQHASQQQHFVTRMPSPPFQQHYSQSNLS